MNQIDQQKVVVPVSKNNFFFSMFIPTYRKVRNTKRWNNTKNNKQAPPKSLRQKTVKEKVLELFHGHYKSYIVCSPASFS